MEKIQIIERATQDNNWVAFLFLGSFIIVAIIKSVFEKQFNDFLGLIYTNKYLKIYSSENNSLGWFSVFMIFIQLIAYTFLIHIILSQLSYINKNSFTAYGVIFIGVTALIVVKFLLEKGIASLFNIQEFYNKFLFHKATYLMYFGLFLLLTTFIIFYNPQITNNLPYLLIGLFGLFYTISYFISIKYFQKEITSRLFYFILYLCTLEIAPYYFIYYWLTQH